MKTCVYAGSFDPITNGHLNIIERASNIFDKVVVAIGSNPNKTYTFSIEERMNFIKYCIQPIRCKGACIEVASFEGLLADFSYSNNIQTIVKGVRNTGDFDYEKLLHEISITQQSGLDTAILIADQKLSHVSSSAAKELVKHGGFVHDYVPLRVKFELERKIRNQILIGVTGGIACGKTTYCNNEVSNGRASHHIDLDDIVRFLYTSRKQVHVSLQEKVLKEFNLPRSHDGSFPKSNLAKLVFSDEQNRKKLENLIKLPILTELRSRLNKLTGYILVSGALIVEYEMMDIFNNDMVVINLDYNSQKLNLINRGLSEEEASLRIDAQLPNVEKINRIKDKIKKDNFGSLSVIDNKIL